MNKFFVILIAVLMASCASSPSSVEPPGLVSLDKAIDSAVAVVEAKVAGGTTIAVYEITAPHDKIGNYMGDSLGNRFGQNGKLKPLARGSALRTVLKEHELQMLGIVTDKSAAELGSLLGAKVVITGTFNRYVGFSQLRIRAVDVQTAALLTSYDVRISNRDAVLAGLLAPLGAAPKTYISEEALVYFNRGKDLHAAIKIDTAILTFDRAIALAPDFAEAYFYRGVAYVDKGNYDRYRGHEDFAEKDYDRAIADYTQAIKLNPKYADAYNNRGVVYVAKGSRYRGHEDFAKKDYDRAIADYTQAIKLNPNHADAYNNRGNVYYHKHKDYDRAMSDYTQAIKLNPNHAGAYFNRAYAYADKKDYDRAIVDYTDAIKIDPKYADAYNNRGNVYLNKKDYDRAIADYTQIIKLNPNDAKAYFNRAYAYADKKDYDRAIADYTQAIKLNPKYADAYNNRGLVYYYKQDYDRAIADYTQAIKLYTQAFTLNVDYTNYTIATKNLEIAKQAKAAKK